MSMSHNAHYLLARHHVEVNLVGNGLKLRRNRMLNLTLGHFYEEVMHGFFNFVAVNLRCNGRHKHLPEPLRSHLFI